MGLTKTPTFTLVFHVLMGTIALLSGIGALVFKKGSRPHRLSGNIFTISMMLMSVTGLYLAVMKHEVLSIIASILTFYLVLTFWVAAKRKHGATGYFESIAGAFIFLFGCAVILWGLKALSTPSTFDDPTLPYQAYFVFGGLAIFAGVCDLRLMFSGGITGAKRIVRHLWRMCFALLIAATSIFQGNAQVFSEKISDTTLAVPTLTVLGLMIFWIIKVRFTNWYKSG